MRKNNFQYPERQGKYGNPSKIIDLCREPARLGVEVYGGLKRRIVSPGINILIACMPKTGSTYLSNMLSNVTGFNRCPMVFKYSRNEQQLYLPRAIDAFGKNTVTQIHMRATGPNLKVLRDYRIKPVVLVRNIFDIVISLHDHMRKESLDCSMCYATDDFFDYDKEQAYDFVIDLALPWFFNFYASWDYATSEEAVLPYWLTYEDMIRDKEAAVNDVLGFYGIRPAIGTVKQAVDDNEAISKNRYNKGICGRGQTELSERQIARIRNYAGFYPNVDFSRIGL